MKKSPARIGHLSLSPLPKKLALAVLIASATAVQAEIIVSESFVGYNPAADLLSQTATGTGLTGTWSGSQYYRTSDTGLTMSGVYSTGGSLVYPGKAGAGNGGRTAFAAFETPLSADMLYYGSYLFSFSSSVGTQPRTVGGLGVGTSTDNDNTASFVWAGNGYNTQASPVREGPGVRAEGSSWQVPGISLSMNTTYIMLFEFDATAKTTTAWVLNQNQLANFYGSLNSTTLNAATANTEASTGIAWRGTASTASAVGAMSHLITFGNLSDDNSFAFRWDEIRFSDTSLFESVTAVPEPSTIAIAMGLGLFAVTRAIRRRRGA